MSNCKNCHSSEVTKNGFVRSKQRYRCKTCGYNFVEGDERTNPQTTIKRAFAVILYSLAKHLMALLPTCLMYRQVLFKNGLQRKQPCCRSLRFQSIPVNWNLMRCGILSGQKKQKMDSQSSFS